MKFNNHEIPNIFQLKEHFIKKSFWFLYWIDGLYIIDGIKYADFHFINKDTPDDKFNGFQKNCRVTTRLKFSLTSFFSIGCIFDEYGRLVRFPEGSDYNCDVITISEDYDLIKARGNIQELSENVFYPFPSFNLINEIYYFTENVKIKGSNIKVIIPVLSVCNYLYFKSEIITDCILSNELSSFFSFHEIERDNVKTGYFEYDNSKILNDEIQSIAHFFFLKESLGLKSMNLIGNYIILSLIQNKIEKNNKQIHLNTIIPFSNVADYKLRGKIININSKKYFFTYAIEDIILKDNLFRVDKIILVPRYPEIQYFENTIKYFREKHKRTRRKLYEGYKNLRAVEDYNGVFFPVDFFLKNPPLYFGLNIQTQMTYDELITIHHNLYLNNDKAITLKSNYIYLICESLINDIRFQNVNFIVEENVIFRRKETIIIVNELEFNVWVIEIKYKNFYFYLIDFLRDHIGLVSSKRENSRITPLTMKVFLYKIIYNYFRYPDFYIWFKIKQDKSIFVQDFGIDILDFLEYNPKDAYCDNNKVDERVSFIEQKLDDFLKKAV